jgi:hypothetical protein
VPERGDINNLMMMMMMNCMCELLLAPYLVLPGKVVSLGKGWV